MLSIDLFYSLVEIANNKLLSRTPTIITYDKTTKIIENTSNNEKAIRQEVGDGANIYALWSRDNDSDSWRTMYIGQRTQRFVIERIKQHLFNTPNGTQSKLEKVRLLAQEGKQIGITTVLINPDPLRLSVEDQLIYSNTSTNTDLPWNNKSRNVALRST
ncbi:hypothetical protein [Marichromatium sp. AB32]|uniref:hypothetical protein n=1 Tax=Marichromatium sp. AB32 TaxID=2483363 RepID=UPI0011CE97F8|nr:hypothetical protein [Marichromatium sp. AB32]